MDTEEHSLSDFFGILSEPPSPKRQGRIPRSTSDLSLTGLLSEHAVRVMPDTQSPFVSREINTVDPDEVDLLMAQKMMQITMEEREEVYCDLHGVADEVMETPELIIQAISKMKLELSKIQNAAAYQQALAKDSNYVHRQEFLLQFLRAERFDAVRAASRFVNFYSLKLEAFGLKKLTQDIFQEDLTETERKGLYESMTYDLPFRDRAGRAIIFKMGTSVSVPMNELLRRGMYASLSYSRDEENQKKGLVVVAYHMGDEYRSEDLEQRGRVNEHWGRLLACLPLRYQAIHCCFDSRIWRPTTANFRMSVDLFTGLRTMEHYGDHKAVRFALRTHGIPSLGFPVTDEGSVMRHLCREHWHRRRLLEYAVRFAIVKEQSSSAHLARITTPNQNDVLLGRGKAYYTHVGNIRLRCLIVARMSRYQCAPVKEKYRVSDSVVDVIHERGGRFLKGDHALWFEVDRAAAQKKISYVFRDLRRELVNGKDSSCGGDDRH